MVGSIIVVASVVIATVLVAAAMQSNFVDQVSAVVKKLLPAGTHSVVVVAARTAMAEAIQKGSLTVVPSAQVKLEPEM